MILKCHCTPKSLEPNIKRFLKKLTNNDIFLLEIRKNNIDFNIEISFISSLLIKKLNNIYRHLNNSTDVLSFSLNNIGEIYLCLKDIKKNSKDFSQDFSLEVERCIIHGCLHIFGYDHTEKLVDINSVMKEPMFLIQEKILSQCHIK